MEREVDMTDIVYEAASVAYETVRKWGEVIKDPQGKVAWNLLPESEKDGYAKAVGYRIENPETTEVDMHNKWSADKFEAGWTYGEKLDFVKKTHPNLVPFEDLPVDQQMKDKLFLNVIDAILVARIEEIACGITRYTHHGKVVYVQPELKGKHRDHCLCFQGCSRFIPENREENCPIANKVYKTAKKYGIVSPVWECPDYITE